MGKAKKIKVSKGEAKVGLADQIEHEKTVKSKNRQKSRLRANEVEEVSRFYFCLYYSKL